MVKHAFLFSAGDGCRPRKHGEHELDQKPEEFCSYCRKVPIAANHTAEQGGPPTIVVFTPSGKAKTVPSSSITIHNDPETLKLPLRRCGRCLKTQYCDSICQAADWATHRFLCMLTDGAVPESRKIAEIRAFIPWVGEEHIYTRRALYFSPNDFKPRFLPIPDIVPPGIDYHAPIFQVINGFMGLFKNGDAGRFLDIPQSTSYLDEIDVGKHTMKYTKSAMFTFNDARGTPYDFGHAFRVIYLNPDLLHDLKQNNAITQCTGESGKRQWGGPVLVIKQRGWYHGRGMIIHVEASDMRDIIDGLGSVKPLRDLESMTMAPLYHQLRPGGKGLLDTTSWGGKQFRGVNILCEGDRDKYTGNAAGSRARIQYIDTMILSNHPAFSKYVPVSPLGDLFGIPLRVWKLPDQSQDPAFSLKNEPAAALLFDPKTMTIPPEYQDMGSVFVVGPVHNEIWVEEVESFAAYCGHILSTFKEFSTQYESAPHRQAQSEKRRKTECHTKFLKANRALFKPKGYYKWWMDYRKERLEKQKSAKEHDPIKFFGPLVPLGPDQCKCQMEQLIDANTDKKLDGMGCCLS
ncbi:hypothetical protein DFH27DRAFT_623133 [Peziza echinospora]|nr:hypothetical protein DFH27DRAFT_623133 [Peziza echinospora]